MMETIILITCFFLILSAIGVGMHIIPLLIPPSMKGTETISKDYLISNEKEL